MEIRINGQDVDITIDSEKTIGEIIAGLDRLLANSGHRLSGLSIDGQAGDTSLLEQFFSREIDSVKTLDIYTKTIAELTAISLLSLIGDIEEYESLKFEEKGEFIKEWKERPQSLFASEQAPELYSLYNDLFSNGGIGCQALRSITEEWLREVENPQEEFAKLNPLVEEICSRLVDFPLDIQTGKDARAAQSITIFSGITEKIFRILGQLNNQGYLSQADDEKPLNLIISEFGSVVRELLEAYEKNDSVLVGDLAEYEAAPRLQELYNSIINNSRKAAAQGKK